MKRKKMALLAALCVALAGCDLMPEEEAFRTAPIVREYQREYRRAYRAKQKALKAAAENQAPQSPAKLSDQELENIYQGLKDKGLV